MSSCVADEDHDEHWHVVLADPGSMRPARKAARRPRAARSTQLAWLAGTWRGGDGPVSFEERWTPASRRRHARRLAHAERRSHGRLRVPADRRTRWRLVYIAQPNGRPPTEFTLTAITADSVTFENPMHDFPKMIRYAKRADGSLEARVSDGGQKSETFVFKKRRRGDACVAPTQIRCVMFGSTPSSALP